MDLPQGYEAWGLPEGADPKEYCWKLNKSLYGLKQSGNCWNKEFDGWMKSYGTKDGATGFTQCWNDQCCYYNERINSRGQKGVLIVAVCVDDIQIYGNNGEWIHAFKSQLKVHGTIG